MPVLLVCIVVPMSVLDSSTKFFYGTQVQGRFEILKKRKDVGSFTEQGKAMVRGLTNF